MRRDDMFMRGRKWHSWILFMQANLAPYSLSRAPFHYDQPSNIPAFQAFVCSAY